jgi:tRNA modification GTPase
MRAPRSFTGEDVVELSCHGGPLVLGRVLGQLLACGARLATPGEFTMRAFLNGRIDLTQAEATLDVITARTSSGLALAQAQLGGWLARELHDIRELVLGPLAYCTALVDFPEDELERQPIAEPLREALQRLEHLLATADQGIVYRQGARAAIIGRPNAGKSSLLNALLRADRAIVTPIPGTTRDTLEETASLGGVPVVLIDTAGIAETVDLVEQIGIRRSRSALAGADLALLLVDATDPHPADAEIAALTTGKPTILVINKIDLLPNTHQDEPVRTPYMASLHPFIQDEPVRTPYMASLHPFIQTVARQTPYDAMVAISALTGQGIDQLAQAVARLLLGGVALSGAHLITNPRHRDALTRVVGHVREALAAHEQRVPHDLLGIDLTAALVALGEITGETIGEDLLNAIFSRFCIGK